jgi:hypothetical protein
MPQMTRFPVNRAYVLAPDAVAATLAQVIDTASLAGGSVETTAAQTITIFQCNRDDPVGKTFTAAHDEDGVALSITAAAAGGWPLPTACYHYRTILLVDAGGGTVYLHQKS